MGAISDRTKTKMGRRRPYILFGSILLGLSIAGLFYAPIGASEMYKASYLLVLYLLASTAITIFDVPYSSMAAEMTNNYKERTSLIGYKSIAARLGILIVLFAVPTVFANSENLAVGFRLVGIGFGVFIVLTGLTSFYLTKDVPRFIQPVSKFTVRDELKAVRENKPFRALWTVFLFQNLAIGASATSLLYMLTLVINVERNSIGSFMAVSAVVGTIATPFWVFFGRKMEKRKGYYIALILSLLALIPFLFIQPNATTSLFFMLVFVGIADAATQLFPNAMVPDTVEVDELQTGERREGTIFGAWAFCRKFGMTAGAFLVSLMLSAFGLVKGGELDVQPESALLGIRLSYSLLPMTLWIIALLLLHRYKLSGENFNAIKKQIVEKQS